jgi:hypothetical protein
MGRAPLGFKCAYPRDGRRHARRDPIARRQGVAAKAASGRYALTPDSHLRRTQNASRGVDERRHLMRAGRGGNEGAA